MSSHTEQDSLEWSVDTWFNYDGDLKLVDLRGRVVALEAFQMLCPGCVSHGIPQAQRIRKTFSDDVAVVGIHTVFEHHKAMEPHALGAFLHEYRVRFPVGVDRPTEGRLPETMGQFQLQGTPSLLLFDHHGRLRSHHFGSVADMQVGAEIGALLAEARAAQQSHSLVAASTNNPINLKRENQ